MVIDVFVFVNIGVNKDNVIDIFFCVSGVVIGMYFKYDGNIWNKVEVICVKCFMDVVNVIC